MFTCSRVGSADGVYVVDAKGRFLLWNAAAARIAGVVTEEALAMGYDAIGAADRQGRSLATLDRMAYGVTKIEQGAFTGPIPLIFRHDF